MEDTLNFLETELRAQLIENGRHPHFLEKTKTTSLFWKMEDNLKKIQIEDDLKRLKQYHFENRRRT